MMTKAEVRSAERGQALYDTQIRAQVEGEHRGKFLILDVNTGDYEIDAEDLTACHRLLERRPDAVLFGVRVGHRAAYRLGIRSVSLKG
jgi:hypothetical protein